MGRRLQFPLRALLAIASPLELVGDERRATIAFAANAPMAQRLGDHRLVLAQDFRRQRRLGILMKGDLAQKKRR
jgi:hypothetical protein